MQSSIYEAYKDRGVVVWAVGSADPYDTLAATVDYWGLTFPVLYDEGGTVLDQYSQQTAFAGTIFPQDWIIGVDGKVAYVNSGYEPDEMMAVLEAELAAPVELDERLVRAHGRRAGRQADHERPRGGRALAVVVVVHAALDVGGHPRRDAIVVLLNDDAHD